MVQFTEQAGLPVAEGSQGSPLSRIPLPQPTGILSSQLLRQPSLSIGLPSSHASKPACPKERSVRRMPSPQFANLQSLVHSSCGVFNPSSHSSFDCVVLSPQNSNLH